MLLAALLLPLAHAGPNTALLGMNDTRDPALLSALTALDAQLTGCFHSARLCVFEFPDPPPIAQLNTLPGVRYAELDSLMSPGPSAPNPGVDTPTSPPLDSDGTSDCPDQWELTAIGATQVWDQVDGARAPVVAIQDTGFLLSHIELEGRISRQYDYGNGDTDPEVEWGSVVPDHGTFIAGVIAGHPDNGRGRSGVMPYGQLNLQKIANRLGQLYFSYAVLAMADIAEGDLGVRVLSYSLGGNTDTDAFEDAVQALGQADILLVAAAGNCASPNCGTADNDRTPLYPASYDFDHILSVASTLRDGTLNPYSHYGASSVDLGAPGVDLCSCGVRADDNFYTAGGTSYATPLVASAAALVLEAHPELSAVETARVVRASAQHLPELDGRVRSGGNLYIPSALATAVPRLEAPEDLTVEGSGPLNVSVQNPGAEGEGWLVVSHPAGLRVRAPTGWTLEPHGSGQIITLPDAGDVTLGDDAVTLMRGPLPEHAEQVLELQVRGIEVGTWTLQTRLIATSEGADYLNAPFDQGEQDPTGFLAWQSQVRVNSVWEGQDTGVDTAGDSGGDSRGDDSEPADTQAPGDPSKACACASTRTSPPLALPLLMGLVAVVRRRVAHPHGATFRR